VFRKKGESLLKRIAKYYGLTIEITGQIDVPEGFAVESTTGRDLHSHVNSSNLLQLQADAEANKASSSKTKQTQHPGKHAAAEANGKKSANEPPPAPETSTKGRKGKQGKQKPDSESTPNNAKQGTGSQPAKMDSQATASNESIPVGIVVGDGPANKVFICLVARFCVVMESATSVSSFTICFRNRELYLKDAAVATGSAPAAASQFEIRDKSATTPAPAAHTSPKASPKAKKGIIKLPVSKPVAPANIVATQSKEDSGTASSSGDAAQSLLGKRTEASNSSASSSTAPNGTNAASSHKKPSSESGIGGQLARRAFLSLKPKT
jgi:hypothetical protein